MLAQNGTVTSSPSQVEPSIAHWHHALGDPLGHVVRHRGEETRLRELGDVGRVEAHQVDRGVLRGEAPDELLALLGRLTRQLGDRDRYRPPASSVHRLAISACPPESGLMYQVSVGGPAVVAPAGGQRAGGDEERRGAGDARRLDLLLPGSVEWSTPAGSPQAGSVRASVIASVGLTGTGGHRCHGAWCRSQRVSIRIGRGPGKGHRTDTPSRAAPQVSASGARPAITDGVVTSLGVRGRTVAK